MGNSFARFFATPVGAAIIIGGSAFLVFALLLILGFVIYKIVKHFQKEEYDDDDKTNYEEDLKCLNQNKGKTKNFI